MTGTIMKGIGGFYYVKCEQDGAVYSCRARGKFRKDGLTPVVGDTVKIDVTSPEKKRRIRNRNLSASKRIFSPPPYPILTCF